MIKVTDIAFTGYPVTDVPKARHFYETLLGLKPQVYCEEKGQAWIEYVLPSGTLAISDVNEAWKPSADGPSIALEVEDLNAAVSELDAAGIKIVLPPFESPVCFIAAVSDPDGNTVMLHRKKDTHPDLQSS